MQIAVCCWWIQTTMQCAGQFTVRSVCQLLRCNVRTIYPRNLRPHSEFCSKHHWTYIGSIIVCRYHWLQHFHYCVQMTTARSDRNREPMQLQAFRTDLLPRHFYSVAWMNFVLTSLWNFLCVVLQTGSDALARLVAAQTRQ